jgi:tetratricopeptide (TPR) repeat protein
MGDNDATLIFSNNFSSWGSFFYDPREDALRVTVKTIPTIENVEWLKYEFMNETDNSAVIALMWEKLKIPFKVEVDLVKTQMASFKNELQTHVGFDPTAWQYAAQYAVDNNTGLEDALKWSDYSINGQFVGQKNFKTLSTRAAVLNKLGKTADADAAMKEAMPLATMQELHQYGRSLIQNKRPKEALEVFKLNAQKNPDVFTTDMGLVRGYSAVGDYQNALKYAKMAQPLAPNKQNKDAVDDMIIKLAAGKDVN